MRVYLMSVADHGFLLGPNVNGLSEALHAATTPFASMSLALEYANVDLTDRGGAGPLVWTMHNEGGRFVLRARYEGPDEGVVTYVVREEKVIS